MNIVQIDLANRRQVRDFLSLPSRIYRDIPQWVPPLERVERVRLDPKQCPFYRHSAAAFFLAYREDIPVGRLAVLENRLYNDHNHEKTAFFYLFECEPDLEPARRLFEFAFAWARARGLERMLGPRGFTALDGLGLLVKGFEHRPALGMPYNPSYYPEFVEALGFEKVDEIVSGHLGADIQFPERIHELAARIQERRGLHIARFRTRNELRAMLGHLKTLYNSTLAGTSGGTPITDEEIKSLAGQMLWLADPNLIKIVMKDEKPVGFLLAYPDISVALQKTKGRLFPFGWITIWRELRATDWININGAGMIEEYRGLGGTAILYSEMFKSVTENRRYRHAEVVQIGLENDKMQREMENFGVDFYKMHRTYQKILSWGYSDVVSLPQNVRGCLMVKIVADTTSGLPREMLKTLAIPLIPQIVVFGEESYRDDTELDTATFLQKLKASAQLPKTAAPPPTLYNPVFEQAARDGEDVIVVAPSAKVSGTVRSAEVAAQDFPKLKVHVVDTQTVAGNLASLVLLAHEWAREGMNADAIVKRLNEWIPRGRIYFLVDTLEYLQKGGRIGGAKALLGELLQVKPILCLQNGQVEPFEQQRTKRRALARLIEIVAEQCPKCSEANLCVMQADAMEEAEALAADLRSRMNLTHIPIYELPPAIVVHGGPGVLGIGFFVP